MHGNLPLKIWEYDPKIQNMTLDMKLSDIWKNELFYFLLTKVANSVYWGLTVKVEKFEQTAFVRR